MRSTSDIELSICGKCPCVRWGCPSNVRHMCEDSRNAPLSSLAHSRHRGPPFRVATNNIINRPPASAKSPRMKLTQHRALVFDVYGTLVDWESAIHDAFVPVFPDLPRGEILANYAAAEANLQMQFQSTPYAEILDLAYCQLATPSGVTTADIAKGELRKESRASTDPSSISDDAQRFGRSIVDWRPFPDTIDALHRLKKYFALVVLSNIDDRSFAGTHEKLCTVNYPGSAYRTVSPDSPFSLILTAQQVGAYKPNPLMLASALKQLSKNPDPLLPSHPSVHVDASDVLVVANSLRHDIVPAMQQGLHSVWISRYGVNLIGNESSVAAHHPDREGVVEGSKCPYTWRYETLSGMADAVEQEMQGETLNVV